MGKLTRTVRGHSRSPLLACTTLLVMVLLTSSRGLALQSASALGEPLRVRETTVEINNRGGQSAIEVQRAFTSKEDSPTPLLRDFTESIGAVQGIGALEAERPRLASYWATWASDVAWVTYTDPVHGYTFDYPLGWTIEPTPNTGIGGVTTVVDPSTGTAIYVGLSLRDRVDSVSLAEWVEPDDNLRPYLESQSQLALGPRAAVEQIFSGNGQLSQIIYATFGSRVLFLNIVGVSPDFQELLRLMASSLRYDSRFDTSDHPESLTTRLYSAFPTLESGSDDLEPNSTSSVDFILPFSGKAKITQTGDDGLTHNCSGGSQWDCQALDIVTRGINNMDGRIYAAEAGTVVYYNWDPNGYGNLVKVRHSNGMVSWYAHLSYFEPRDLIYSRGTVRRGEWIGTEGDTGCKDVYSCPPHLHFAVKQGEAYTSTPVDISNGLLPRLEFSPCLQDTNCGWAFGGPSIYKGVNLTGWSQVFGANDNSLSDEFVKAHETHSIRVPIDWILITYTGEGYTGSPAEYDGPFADNAWLTVSSLKAAFRSCPARTNITEAIDLQSGICSGDTNDSTPPSATGFSASVIDGRRAEINTSGVEDNSGGSGVREVRFSAMWNGNWYGIGTDGSTPYSLSWDMCSSNVPNGDVELGMEVWDNANNVWVWSNNHGNPHITKDSACGGSGDPLAGDWWHSQFWMNKYLAGYVNWEVDWLWDNGRWPYIYFDWGINGPKEGWSGDEFSLRIWRSVYFPGGHYEFRSDGDDGVKVYVDGNVVVDHWWDAGSASGGRTISEGWHEVKVEYFENTGNAKLYVVWYGPGYPQPDSNNPDGRISSPAHLSAVNYTPLTIWADAWDDVSGVDYVRFMAHYCQGGNCGWHELGMDSSAPYGYTWNWDAIGEQHVWLAIHVADKSGKVTYDPGGWVEVDLDKTSPAAEIITPLAGSYLTVNTVQVSALASDGGSGIESVHFYAGYSDGSGEYWHELGIDADGANGWNASWNASGIDDQRDVSFFVYAYDKAGNYTGIASGASILDRTPPTSAVTNLPSSSPPSFTVNWSGSDNAAGLASYDVQYQQDGGSWQNWLAQTTETSSTFTGSNGHTYGFRSRARDLAGHVEAWPSSADAVTTIDRAIPPAPHNFRATDGELIAEVRLLWDSSPGATTYAILYSEPGSSEVHLLGSSDDTFFSDGQHVDGTIWAYAVKACSEAGCSDFSNFDTGYADMPILNPIDNPEGDGAFTISWVAANTANSYRLEEQRDYGNWTNIYWGNLTSQTVSGKEEGTWCYRVSAHSGIQGDSPWTEPKCTYVGTEVDTVAPVVEWGWPVGNGMTFNATNEEVSLEVEATDNRSVTVVQFSWLDETTNIWQTFAEDTAAPYQHLLDLSILPIGCTKVDAMAFDAVGNASSEYIWICAGVEPSWKTFVPTILR